MKITCNIIRDILPLYYENMVSSDTSHLVEEHLKQCTVCKKHYEEMYTSTELPIDNDISPFLKIKSTLEKNKIKTVLLTLMLSIIFGVVLIRFLTVPEFIPYSEQSVTIEELTNGTVIAKFSEDVADYDLEINSRRNNGGVVYHLTTWNSIWNRKFQRSHEKNTVLNPNDEKVVAVYYYEPEGGEDILIYGSSIVPSNGGVLTLPRLFLSYYASMAVIVTMVCGFVTFLFRKNKRIKNMAMKILFIPLSYLGGHFIIKGFKTASYTATRDFYAILLLAIVIYLIFLIALNIIAQSKYRRGG